MDIINETKKGNKKETKEDPATRSKRNENEMKMDVIKKEAEENNSMLINVPADNLRKKERIQPEPPPIITIGPNHEEYENLLERAVALNEKVKSESEDVRNMIGEQKLADATCHLKGATGDSKDLDRNILSLVTEDGSIVNIDCRKVEDLGVNGKINELYEQGVKQEFKMSKEQELLFELRKKSSKIMILIGVKSGSLLGKQVEPESLGLQKPVCSPDLTIWKSRLSKKYYITGQLGIQKELIDRKLNYPTFYKSTDDVSTFSTMASKINIKEKINSFSITKQNLFKKNNLKNK